MKKGKNVKWSKMLVFSFAALWLLSSSGLSQSPLPSSSQRTCGKGDNQVFL
jgi:hypothetical protein